MNANGQVVEEDSSCPWLLKSMGGEIPKGNWDQILNRKKLKCNLLGLGW